MLNMRGCSCKKCIYKQVALWSFTEITNSKKNSDIPPNNFQRNLIQTCNQMRISRPIPTKMMMMPFQRNSRETLFFIVNLSKHSKPKPHTDAYIIRRAIRKHARRPHDRHRMNRRAKQGCFSEHTSPNCKARLSGQHFHFFCAPSFAVCMQVGGLPQKQQNRKR